MLSEYRILDLTDDRGLIGGMILADLGADVIAIEPPDGNVARQRGPFTDGSDNGDIEDSLIWQSYARGKRSVVLDLESQDGRARFSELARSADAVIESADFGAMDALGIGYESLAKINPGLIFVAVTPFGSTGPKAGWAATDITVAAAAGPMIQSGDRDRPPLRVGLPQTALHAGAEAALGVLMGLHERKRSGLGQFIDVSAQAAYAQATQSGIIAAANNSGQFQRSAVGAALGPLEIRLFWPCKDGHVAITYLFGAAIGPFTDRLMQYALEEGYCDQETRDKDWLNYTNLILTGQEPISEYFRCCEVVGALCADKTKAELFQVAQERRLLIVPVSTMDDLDENEHLAARSYWREVERGGQTIKFPGPFARLSETPIEYARPAPMLGEHTDEVLAVDRQAASLNRANAATPILPPLSGLKMLDLMWVMAGPAGTRALCDFGISTVRIESSTRIDTARTLQPFIDDEATQPEGSSMFHNMNAGKQMMTVDPAKPQGRELILDLVRWADVVTESFTPRAMRGWDLTWETIHEVNPARDHDVLLPHGTGRSAGRVRRLRQPGRRLRRLHSALRLARPLARRTLRRIHRLRRAALRLRRAAGRPRRARPHRSGTVHRRLPDGGRHSLPHPGLPPVPIDRREVARRRQQRPVHVAARRLPLRGRRLLGRHRLPRRRRPSRAGVGARRRSPRRLDGRPHRAKTR